MGNTVLLLGWLSVESISSLHRQPQIMHSHCRVGTHSAHVVTTSNSREIVATASAYNEDMHNVELYSRAGCHLCEVAKEMLTRLQRDADFQWREVDIDTDPGLRQKYNEEVPVVFVNGRKVFKYHIDRKRFLQVLARRA